MFDPKGRSLSYAENRTDGVISANLPLLGFDLYANGESKLMAESEFKLLSINFNDLSRTTMITAQVSPLREEGEQRHQLLLSHDVKAYWERSPAKVCCQ